MTNEQLSHACAVIMCVGGAALAILLYFLPAWIGRQKRNRQAIFVLNLLLGWTFIGWVACLVWAMTEDPPMTVDDKLKAALRRYVK